MEQIFRIDNINGIVVALMADPLRVDAYCQDIIEGGIIVDQYCQLRRSKKN